MTNYYYRYLVSISMGIIICAIIGIIIGGIDMSMYLMGWNPSISEHRRCYRSLTGTPSRVW